ncbi:MAG TPA: hypothetical protein VMV03_04545 [Spirochaetia bacterium]|nr:hypothetical protein [Spirochaetia bacterium]
MRTRVRGPAILFILLIAIQPLAAQTKPALQSFPELTPLPLAEQLSTTREPLAVETMVDAALQFSGAPEDVSAADKDKLAALMKRFRDEVADLTGQEELAEKTLIFLHRNLLTTYTERQTRIDTALETGVFNCVSSAVLYMILAKSVALSVGGVRTVDHVFCTVMISGEPVDVETTNPYGYNPGTRKEFSDSFGKVTGFSYVPPSNYHDRRVIGEKELLALILYNRVSEYTAGRYYRDAVGPSVSAYALMGNDEFRGFMVTAFSNYVTWMASRRDFPRAIQFTDVVKASFGGTVDLEPRRREVYHNWAVSLIQANALVDAEALLSQPPVRSSLGDEDWTGLSIAVIQSRADQETRGAGFLAAAQIVTDGIRKIGAQPLLLQTYEAYMHDAFAQLYNARKLADARAVIDQGLAAYPESRILGQDRDMLRRTPPR